MKQDNSIAKMLREYRMNKERINFLENRIKRFSPELNTDYTEYIESKMFTHGHWDKTLKLAVVNGEEVAVLNNVEETAENYRLDCENEYGKTLNSFKKEITRLLNCVYIVEDSLEVMGKYHEKYKVILESYYIRGESMEDIAENLHLSRSRCYELCKKAVEYMDSVVFGTQKCCTGQK